MPCDATCVLAAFLKGVCLLATATRLLGANDGVGLYSWDAWRTGERSSDLLVATCDWAQAASEAAPATTASRCMKLRIPEPEPKGVLTRMRFALTSTNEVLAQLMENI